MSIKPLKLPDEIEDAIKDVEDSWRHANGGNNYLEMAQRDSDRLRVVIWNAIEDAYDQGRKHCEDVG